MTTRKPDSPPPRPNEDAATLRRRRQAEALRANLRRRKQAGAAVREDEDKGEKPAS